MTQVKKRAGIEIDVVRQLADVLNASGLTEIEYDAGDFRIRVARAATAPAMAPGLPGALPTPPLTPGGGAPAAAEAGAVANEGFSGNPGLLTSPMVGIVYTAQEPSAPPFVKPGDVVSVGDTVLLIEAMKVFNPIKAHCSGRIERIFINSGMPVEFGEPLLLIT